MKTLIVGSGMAGAGLFLEMQKQNMHSDVVLVTSEQVGYYSRPLLSHGFSDDKIFSRMLLKNWEDMQAKGFAVRSGTWVNSIDRAHKVINVTDCAGENLDLSYDHLILATGSTAFVPPAFQGSIPGVFVLNGWNDLQAMRLHRQKLSHREKKCAWAVIGGGYIGCEVASDLLRAGDSVTIINAEERLMKRTFTEGESGQLNQHLSAQGAAICNGFQSEKVLHEPSEEFFLIATDGKVQGPFDGIIVAAGFRPRTSLAENAHLKIGDCGGIAVDSFLRTSDESIFALGDVASVEGTLYPFVAPIRSQVKWLSEYLSNAQTLKGWEPGNYKPKLKVHQFSLHSVTG
jgi:NAD(P)H-nitrite reductase large subunit